MCAALVTIVIVLQVEMAGITYRKAHIMSALESKHLAQQRGGGAFLAGAGETQLEIERRMLLERERYCFLALSTICITAENEEKFMFVCLFLFLEK